MMLIWRHRRRRLVNRGGGREGGRVVDIDLHVMVMGGARACRYIGCDE